MGRQEKAPKRSNLLFRVLGVVVVSVFVVVGLAGLILPIIPGILFLFLAVYLMTRISRRFHGMMQRNPRFKRWSSRIGSISRLSLLENLKLGFWISARGVINLLNTGMTLLGKSGDRLQTLAQGSSKPISKSARMN